MRAAATGKAGSLPAGSDRGGKPPVIARRTVRPDEGGQRADVALARLFPTESRSSLARLIREEAVTLDGRGLRPGERVEAGQLFQVCFPEAAPTTLLPEAIPLDILYEDEWIVVVNKPAGLVTHPAPGHPGGTLVNALLYHCPDLAGIGGEQRPGIVHRLDKGTSGVMVAAKGDRAHRGLAAQFRRREVDKRYLAVVWDNLVADEGTVDLAIGRDRLERKKFSARTDVPREAVTGWRVLRRLGWATVVEAAPKTGRTHQIRVHLAYVKHPILGDPLYGRRPDADAAPPAWRRRVEALDRPLLHAHILSFLHPVERRPLVFTAPPPPDLAAFLES